MTGGSGSVPAGVKLPGAFKASDPGIMVNIHAKMSNYVNPGPAVVSSGTTKTAGSACSSGCAKTVSSPSSLFSFQLFRDHLRGLIITNPCVMCSAPLAVVLLGLPFPLLVALVALVVVPHVLKHNTNSVVDKGTPAAPLAL